MKNSVIFFLLSMLLYPSFCFSMEAEKDVLSNYPAPIGNGPPSKIRKISCFQEARNIVDINADDISYINIISKNEKSNEIPEEFNSNIHLGRQYLYEKDKFNEFGLGKLFNYFKKNEIDKDKKDNIISCMNNLVNYHENILSKDNNNRNVLFVRMLINAKDNNSNVCNSYEYLIGLFVSGSMSYKADSVDKFTNLIQQRDDAKHPLKKAIRLRKFLKFWHDPLTKKYLKEYSLISDPEESQLDRRLEKKEESEETFKEMEEISINTILSRSVYNEKIFKIEIKSEIEDQNIRRKFGIVSSAPTPTSSVKKPKKGDINNIIKEQMNTRLFIINDKELSESQKNEITFFLFDKSAEDCLSPKQVCHAFNQSEQSFLSLLERNKDDINADHPNFYPLNPLNNEHKYKIKSVNFYLFSFLDICLYCRGTLHHMLTTKKMKGYLDNFFDQSLKLKDTTFSKDFDINISAFSYKPTQVL